MERHDDNNAISYIGAHVHTERERADALPDGVGLDVVQYLEGEGVSDLRLAFDETIHDRRGQTCLLAANAERERERVNE
jgi:hypothetical protein